jgi:hypothetical protein
VRVAADLLGLAGERFQRDVIIEHELVVADAPDGGVAGVAELGLAVGGDPIRGRDHLGRDRAVPFVAGVERCVALRFALVAVPEVAVRGLVEAEEDAAMVRVESARALGDRAIAAAVFRRLGRRLRRGLEAVDVIEGLNVLA